MVMLRMNEWPSIYFFSDLIHALTGPFKNEVTDLNQDLICSIASNETTWT